MATIVAVVGTLVVVVSGRAASPLVRGGRPPGVKVWGCGQKRGFVVNKVAAEKLAAQAGFGEGALTLPTYDTTGRISIGLTRNFCRGRDVTYISHALPEMQWSVLTPVEFVNKTK